MIFLNGFTGITGSSCSLWILYDSVTCYDSGSWEDALSISNLTYSEPGSSFPDCREIPVAGTANRYNINLRLQVRIFRSDMKSFLVLERCIDLSLVSAKARVPLQQSRPVPRSQSHAHGYIHTHIYIFLYTIYAVYN